MELFLEIVCIAVASIFAFIILKYLFLLTFISFAEGYRKKKDDLGEELADVAIYLMGLSEMLGFDLEDEIKNKVSKNEKRVYKNINGVNVRIRD